MVNSSGLNRLLKPMKGRKMIRYLPIFYPEETKFTAEALKGVELRVLNTL